MTDPDALAAVNPATPLDQLARIASERPDLRPTIAANPSTYDALLDWLAAFHNPQVDAVLALRRRPTAPPPGPPTYATYGTVPYVAYAPAPRAKFMEPMRSVPLLWSTYTARYAVGLALLAFADLFPFYLVYPIGYYSESFNYDLANVIQRGVAIGLVILAMTVFPSTVLRRIIAGALVLGALAYLYSDVGTLIFHPEYETWTFSYIAWLIVSQLSGIGVPIVAWFVLRGRPGVTVLFGVLAALLFVAAIALANAAQLQWPVNSIVLNIVAGILTVGAVWLGRAVHSAIRSTPVTAL